MAMPMNLRLGYRGEQFTVRFLRKQGYDILTVNFAAVTGEIDIVACAPDETVCFVEVKTRTEGGMFPPADAVDSEKRKRLVRTAYHYLATTGRSPKKVRFDISEVTQRDVCTASIHYIEGAFVPDKW